jgi:hypothetical protein
MALDGAPPPTALADDNDGADDPCDGGGACIVAIAADIDARRGLNAWLLAL